MKVCRTARALRESPRRCRQTSHWAALPAPTAPQHRRRRGAQGGHRLAGRAGGRCPNNQQQHGSQRQHQQRQHRGTLRRSRAYALRAFSRPAPSKRSPHRLGSPLPTQGPLQAARRGIRVHDARALPSRSRASPSKPLRSSSPSPRDPSGALFTRRQHQGGGARSPRQGREAAPQARTLDEGEHVATLGLAMGPRDCSSWGAWALARCFSTSRVRDRPVFFSEYTACAAPLRRPARCARALRTCLIHDCYLF